MENKTEIAFDQLLETSQTIKDIYARLLKLEMAVSAKRHKVANPTVSAPKLVWEEDESDDDCRRCNYWEVNPANHDQMVLLLSSALPLPNRFTRDAITSKLGTKNWDLLH